jgi:hypothetical protein
MENFLSGLLVEHLGLDASAAALVASIAIGALFALGTLFLVYILYFRKSFNDQIIYSGNRLVETTDGGLTLELRTFRMIPAVDVLPSNLAFKLNLFWSLFWLRKDNPFVMMSLRDMNVLQPRVINGLSENYATGLMAWQTGAPVTARKLLIAVSYEKHPGANSRTIRVIVSTEYELRLMLDPEVRRGVTFERVYQQDRMDTLLQMARHWQREQKLSPDAKRIVRTVVVYDAT